MAMSENCSISLRLYVERPLINRERHIGRKVRILKLRCEGVILLPKRVTSYMVAVIKMCDVLGADIIIHTATCE